MKTLLLALLAMAIPGVASADAINFQLVAKVLSGSRDRPFIAVTANEAVNNVEVKLKRGDGKDFTWNTGKLRPGAVKKFLIDVPPGESHYVGTLAVLVGKERQEMELDFNAEVVVPAKLTLDKSKVDLKAHTLELLSSRPTSKIEVEVTGDGGQSLGTTELPFDKVAANTPLRVAWKQGEGTVLKISLKVHDTDDFYSGVDLFPWQISIPHEEVTFVSGSAKVAQEEEPKAAKSFALLVDAVNKFGRFAEIKLYVAGHTDTVGPTDANRTLSLNRARALAEYFRRRGLRIPIFYEGFGEQALAVATPDETDEVRNRRAEYIVAIEEPSISNTQYAAGWKRLQ